MEKSKEIIKERKERAKKLLNKRPELEWTISDKYLNVSGVDFPWMHESMEIFLNRVDSVTI